MLACLDPFDHLRISVVLAPVSDENSVLKTPTVTVHLRRLPTVQPILWTIRPH